MKSFSPIWEIIFLFILTILLVILCKNSLNHLMYYKNMAFDVANLNVLFRIASFCCLPICHINPLTHTMGCWDHTQIKCFFFAKNQWSCAWSSLEFFGFEYSCLFRVRFEFFGFQNSKNFEFEFFGFKKIGSKLVKFSSLQVWEKILTKIWPKWIFFGKIFYSSELDLIEF